MVVKILLFISLTVFSVISYSNEIKDMSPDLKSNSLNAASLKFWSNQKVVLTGFEGSFMEVKIITTAPNLITEVRQKKLPLTSQYSISFLDEDHKVLYQVPIGDPFHIYAEHLGHENKQDVLPIKRPYLEVPIPASINPVFTRLIIGNREEIRVVEEFEIYLK